MKKICHITTVHPRSDIRIFHKMCISSREQGYKLFLLVADGRGHEKINNITILDVGKSRNSRIKRMTIKTWKVFRYAQKLNADLYHFHDPELILIGLVLQSLGKQVIYDVHENYPDAIFSSSRDYIPTGLKAPVSHQIKLLENFAARRFAGIITATQAIGQRFKNQYHSATVVNNYPVIKELISNHALSLKERPNDVLYIGTISIERGLNEMINAIGLLPDHLNARLKLAGEFSLGKNSTMTSNKKGWQKTDHLGYVKRPDVKGLLAGVKAGLVLFHPDPNHVNAQPNKIFEYMAAGLPVIASDFPIWREIIKKNECGLLVDPLDPTAIAKAIHYVLEHPSETEKMGKQGQIAVKNRYNWDVEKQKLFQLYNHILKNT